MENPDKEMDRIFGSSGSRFSGFEAEGIAMNASQISEVIAPHLTEERKNRIEDILAQRSYSIATVVEGLANTGNVSAVMRTAEGLGFQPFHIIEGDTPFKHSTRTTQGAQKWLDVCQWPGSRECVDGLRRDGYQIVATHLSDASIPLSEVDLTQKTALVFGNEAGGISQEMLAEADVSCVIPSPGFIQSYNISVAAAMTLYAAYSARVGKWGASGDLSAEDRVRLRADFYMRSTKHAEDVLLRHLGLK